MKKYISILFITLASCNILDVESPNDVAFDNVFKDKDGANAALIGLYSTLQARDYYGGYYPMVADLYSDVGNNGGFDNVSLDEVSTLLVTPANIFMSNTWLALYNTISTANAIIAKVPGINDPTFSAEEKDHIVAQAQAIRALAHFDLLRMFGEHWDLASDNGIPVLTEIQTANSVVARSSVSETYQAIMDDLTEALSKIDAADRSQAFVNAMTIRALRARVNLYKRDLNSARLDAQAVINDGTFYLLDENSFGEIYTSRNSAESIFELAFDVQNRSAYNAITYSRESGLDDFFNSRPGDLRAALVDFDPANNSDDIIPDGRTQKYRGEATRDNPAYIIRVAELHLIIAEANGFTQAGIDALNEVRTNRGLSAVALVDFANATAFEDAILDERKAELNFEGHRMFDLARLGRTEDVLDVEAFRAIFPIPDREIVATKGVITQNPGYQD
jgi:starch-binding outer membrane protein, SusD/RagB family